MNEMMSYIFGTLKSNEASISKLVKIVSKQANKLSLVVMIGARYAIVAEHRLKEQDKKIKQLEEKLEALTSEEVETEVNEP